mmetsp:Transcript_18243/g.26986  ORF Transcript_18243/g.26986 Transcript_18243/m.26986 type:complete len:598 (+) Transcript_18243:1097-2890(+)
MMNFQYDTLAASVRLKDVISSASNRAILHRLKNNDPGLTHLSIDESDDDYGDDDDIFQVREGDDLGWLGYFIGRNEKLKYLSVCYLPGDAEQGRKFFFGIQRNTSIDEVDVSIRGFLGESLSVMNLPHVTSISFDSYSKREDAHYFALGLRQCEALEDYSGLLTAEIVASLVSLPWLSNIYIYKRGGLAINREECMALRELVANATGIIHLDLSRVGLGNDGSELLAEGLACNSSLADGALDLRGNGIGDEGLQALASSLASNAKLRELNLCNNNISDTGWEALAESLAHNRALRVLSIAANTAITETGVRAISRILQSRKSRLEDLWLDSISICEEGGKLLGDALFVNTSLLTLSLRCVGGGMSIDDDGLKALALGLSRNSHLKILNLSENTAITSVGLRSLKQYFRSPSCALDTLFINSINIGDEGACALADALGQNKSLKSLSFDKRGITSKGMKAFLKLICDSSSPNSIYLSHHTLCKLGDRCFGGWGWRLSGSVRTSLDTFLGMNNQTPNLAAKVKIMHVFPDLDMVLLFQWNTKFLPLVKRWFDTVTSDDSAFAASVQNRKLSAIYKFVRAIAGCKLLPTSSHSAASEYQS